MSVFEFNCLYAAKALFMVFVVAPMLFYAGCFAGICCIAISGQHLECDHSASFSDFTLQKCRYWATVQCPLYGRNTPDDFCSRGERWWDD